MFCHITGMNVVGESSSQSKLTQVNQKKRNEKWNMAYSFASVCYDVLLMCLSQQGLSL